MEKEMALGWTEFMAILLTLPTYKWLPFYHSFREITLRTEATGFKFDFVDHKVEFYNDNMDKLAEMDY